MKSVKVQKVSSAAGNMCALIDDIIKKARKNFRETGEPRVDAKFLKESVSALRELYDLLNEYGGIGQADSEGIIVRFEKQLEEWSK